MDQNYLENVKREYSGMSGRWIDELMTEEKPLRAIEEDLDSERFDLEPADRDWIGIGAI